MTQNRGMLLGFLSYTLWGFFPLYWRLLNDRPALEVLAHRFIWSFVFYAIVFRLLSGKRFSDLLRASPRDWLNSALASAILAVNWGVYIHAVNTGRVLEGSLAYFLNPLLNVAVGVLFFHERFPWTLRLAVACAAVGVAIKISLSPEFPAIALILAVTFCAYGVLKKVVRIPAATSSVLEGAAALVPALALAASFHLPAAAEPITPMTWLLFAGSGVVTGTPLFLFSLSVQRIPYSIMGILQFVAPTLQFLVGVLAFGEAFGTVQALSFGFIWAGVGFYLLQAIRKIR